MADGYMLYVGTHAMEDPTRAALLFAAAKAAAAQKYQAKVALLGDAVLLMHPGIAENTLAGPRGSLYKVIAQAIESGVEVHC